MTVNHPIVAAFVAGLLLVLTALPAYTEAPEFPPGTFTDGNSYSLEELRGGVVVLFFYEQNCPRCLGKIPDRNKIVEQFRGQPVTFIAIAAGDSATDAAAYVKRSGLDMPVFADKLSLMEDLYDTKISLDNIWQFRVIDAEGNVVGSVMDAKAINRALATAQQPYRAEDYDEKLAPVVALLNQGKHRAAMRGLRRYLSSRDEAVKASAQALDDAVAEQAKGWMQQADGLMASAPIQAGKLYTNASNVLSREAFGQDGRKKLASLKSSPAVKDETAARKMYAKMAAAIEKMTPDQTAELILFANKIAEKYPESPTGKRCAAMVAKIRS